MQKQPRPWEGPRAPGDGMQAGEELAEAVQTAGLQSPRVTQALVSMSKGHCHPKAMRRPRDWGWRPGRLSGGLQEAFSPHGAPAAPSAEGAGHGASSETLTGTPTCMTQPARRGGLRSDMRHTGDGQGRLRRIFVNFLHNRSPVSISFLFLKEFRDKLEDD